MTTGRTITKEQKAKIKEYKNKAYEMALNTNRADKLIAEKAIKEIYKKMNLNEPDIIWVKSPYAIQYKLNMLNCNVKDIVQVDIRDGIWHDELNNFGINTQSRIWNDIDKNISSDVAINIRDNIFFGITDYFEKIGYVNFFDFSNCLAGGIDAGWLYHYNYFIEVLNRPKTQEEYFKLYFNADKNMSLCVTLKNLVVMSDNPTIAKVNIENKLHCDGGQAWGYADGYGLYFLNGVNVPEWLAVTPAEKLNADNFAKINNVEVRREFIRKFGIERLLKALDTKVIHTMDNYDLLSIDLKLSKRAKALKMINPSIGVYHVEFVPFKIKTVEEALCFRNGIDKYIAPKILT